MSLLAVVLALACALACSVPPAAVRDDAAERLHVVVLHTNDVHGQTLPRERKGETFGGLARLAAKVNELRDEAQAAGDVLFVVDGGDWFQGTPEGVVDGGKAFVEALAAIGYDAMCVGNHEFDFGVPNLRAILDEAQVPAVCANLIDRKTGERVPWVAPWRIVERGGLKVAFVGACTTHTPEMTHPDAREIEFQAAGDALERALAELAGKADLVVPLTHLGVKEDAALAARFPSLPLIVGGHSHTRLHEGQRVGTTLIAQAGTKAEVLGRVDLWIDRDTKRVVESKAMLVELRDEAKPGSVNESVVELARELVAKSEERMKVVVGELTGPLVRSKDPLKSSAAGNFVADALREHAVCDVGMMNRGGIRIDLDAGPITRRNLFEFLPFENNVTVLTMSGAELWSFVARAVEGQAHSGIEVSGLRIVVEVDAAKQRKVVALEVGGAPLDRAKSYRVAMNSFMADGGDAFLESRIEGERRVDDAILMRDVAEKVFVARKRIEPRADDRYEVRSKP